VLPEAISPVKQRVGWAVHYSPYIRQNLNPEPSERKIDPNRLKTPILYQFY
jgi:hypothetical protein